jgi:cell division protein FtsX
MLPIGIFLMSMGSGLLISAISLVYQAKALNVEDSYRRKRLSKEIDRTIYWMVAALIIAFGIGTTFLWFHISSLLPTPPVPVTTP